MPRYSQNKDMHKEAVRLKEAGWEEVRYGKHALWRSPCGTEHVTIPWSPGRHRAVANVRAEISRVFRRLSECDSNVH